MNLNKIMLAGNLTRDPELKYTPKGTPVLDFSIAVNRRWKDENNNVKEDTYYGELRAWNKQAEVIAKHFHKGKPIFIEGRLAQEKWTDKETGKPRTKTLTIVEHWDFCGDARSSTNSDTTTSTANQAPARRPGVGTATGRETMGEVFGEGPVTSEVEGDDIPF